MDDLIIPDTFVTVAPEIKSTDSVWFFKVTETNCVTTHSVNVDTNEIPAGMIHIKGHFLEKIPENFDIITQCKWKVVMISLSYKIDSSKNQNNINLL